MISSADLHCVIEIPKGSRNKYEYDPVLGAITFDRFVSASVIYPTDYGFVPESLGGDGDALDVLVCVTEPTFPGCVIPIRAIGLFRMRDEKGPDDKVVAIAPTDPNWSDYHDVDQLPRALRAEINHFFTVYKDLDETRSSEPMGWAGPDDAVQMIAAARDRYTRHRPA